MIWAPWRKAKKDPLKDAEHQTDDLKQQLRDLRERLLQETVEKVSGDDRCLAFFSVRRCADG